MNAQTTSSGENGGIEVEMDDVPVAGPQPRQREMSGIEIEMDDVDVQMDDQPVAGPQPRQREIPPPRRPEEPMTTYFAPQVECSLVSLLWHHPQFLDLVRHELDFELHISIRAYRKILRAIEIVYGEVGIDLDWDCVGQCLVELGAVDECGGLLGLDQVFTDCGHYPEGRIHPEPTLREYVGLLKEYAITRKIDPLATMRRYTGYGLLRKNKLAVKPAHPAVVGTLRCPCCGHDLELRGWPNGQELKLKAEPEKK